MENNNMEINNEGEIDPATEAPKGCPLESAAATVDNENEAAGGACGGMDVETGGCGGGATECSKHVVVLSNSDDAAPAAVCPLKWCPHVDEAQKVGTIDTKAPCAECGHVGDNWVCLTCHKVMCGRFVNEHMVAHSKESGHQMAMSFADLSIWCYGCESYVQNEKLFEAYAAAHKDKFNEEPPARCFSD